MTNTVLAPLPFTRAFDNAGLPLGGGLLYTYQAGSTIPLATYADLAGTVLNSNPVVLDSTGQSTVRYQPGVAYKLVLTDSTGATQLASRDNYYPPISDQASLGAALYPQTTAELAAGITPTNYVFKMFDIRRYGADPTGTNNSDTALASAISVCGTTGGTITLPAGLYTFSNQIALNAKTSIILQGDAAATGGGQPATRVAYQGTLSPWINMDSSVGCQLRGLQIMHTNASFTGTYIRSNNDGTHGDPAFIGLFDCTVGSSIGGTGNLHLDLNKHNAFTAERCNFIYGNPSVRGAQSGGYSNSIKFRDCRFGSGLVAPVQDGGQAWTFEGCDFEALTSGAAGAILSSASGRTFNGLNITGCWFGDAASVTGSWIDIYGQSLILKGNYISGNASNSTAVVLRTFVSSVIEGNTFDTFLVGINFATATCSGVVLKGNTFNAVTTVISNPSNIASATFDWGANFGLSSPGSTHGILGTNGADVSSTGLITQWGTVNPASFGAHAITPFQVPFATACYNVTATLSGVAATTATIFISALSTTGFTYTIQDGSSTTDSFFWTAIGK
jgi:hypothetical protein